MLKLIIGRRKLPFPLVLFYWRKDETGYYSVKCKKCGWQKTYRIFSGTTWNAPGVTPADNIIKTRKELPAVCLECGGKVNKIKLSNFNKE